MVIDINFPASGVASLKAYADYLEALPSDASFMSMEDYRAEVNEATSETLSAEICNAGGECISFQRNIS